VAEDELQLDENPYASPVASDSADDRATVDSLSRSDQSRNLLLFGACTGAIYLAAPVGYVGVTQASLCRELHASDTAANLPATVYFSLTVMPVVLAWLFPAVRMLKRNLACCFLFNGAAMATVGMSLISPWSDQAKIGVVIAQAAVCGATMPAAIAFLWELIGRGASEARRGWALSLAFGAGPLLAVLGSLGSQLLLDGELGRWRLTGLEFPWNFAALFFAAAPVMLLGATLAGRFAISLPDEDAVRQPFFESVFGGIWNFLKDRVLLTAAAVTILVYTGNTIASNLNLFTSEVLEARPEQYAGLQNALRFGFKTAAGVLLGWLLTKTSPKQGIVTTAAIYVAALAWAMAATGKLYLVAFGLYGAGELVGVYAPNYILSASAPGEIRRNMAIVTMLMAPAAPAGALFGAISDHFGRIHGAATGYRVSFAVCAAVVSAGILVALVALPARPRAAREAGADARRS
jgi:MFS family permease